ncbi:MAG: hypothetical protein AAF681_13310 [Pseudomonadota bacterium]
MLRVGASGGDIFGKKKMGLGVVLKLRALTGRIAIVRKWSGCRRMPERINRWALAALVG